MCLGNSFMLHVRITYLRLYCQIDRPHLMVDLICYSLSKTHYNNNNNSNNNNNNNNNKCL